MKKLIIFLLFLCIQLVAQGQTTYRYWFDNDENSLTEGSSSSSQWQMDIDVSKLTESIHQLHFQIADKNGNWSSVVSRWFVKNSQNSVYCTYWFDEDNADLHHADAVNGRFDIDVSALADGIHRITCQLRSADGSVGAHNSSIFLKLPIKTATTVNYWIDDDSENIQSFVCNDNAHILDVSNVSDGIHILHAQTGGTMPSAAYTQMFIKIPQTEGVDKLTCIFSIDGKLVAQEEVANDNGVLNWTLDVNTIPHGIHHYIVQVLTSTGAASSTYDGYFMRDFTAAEMASLKCVYTIDGDPHRTEAGNLGNGVFHFNLDVADINEGLHSIAYMLVGDNGVCTKSNSALFWKTPIGGNGVMQYNYWLNDQTEKHEVKLAKRTNPFELITLLPVDKMPIRSSCFDFKERNGKPTIFAKNDIHLEFVDASGFVSTVNAQYVDESANEIVKDIVYLKPSQTFSRLEDNEIRWFQLDVERGDSVCFRTSTLATLQLFSSTGEILCEKSGTDANTFFGCHIFTTGRYYLALHDVTGKFENPTLEYNKIGKYDLIDHFPKHLGVLPITHLLKLTGNGYDCLKSAYLENGKTRIDVEDILVDSRADATLLMNFTGEESFGVYDLVLEFRDGAEQYTLRRTSAVEIEEPDLEGITVSISDPRRVASPYPVSYTVTNNSRNLTYIYIPLNLAYQDNGGIYNMKFMNFAIEGDKELTESGVKFMYDISNFKNTGEHVKMYPTILPSLMAGESKTFVVGFVTGAHARFNAYGWAGKPWNMRADDVQEALEKLSRNRKVRAKIPIADPGLDCDIDPCELTSMFGSQLAECGCSTLFNLSSMYGNYIKALRNRNTMEVMRCYGIEEGSGLDVAPLYPLRRPDDFFRQWMSHCLPGNAGHVASAVNDLMDMAGYQNCPNPGSNPSPHPVDPYMPGDPNDIIGYTSESGSKYMRQEISEVSYTIECENDPELANASAHKVVITDKIDGQFYDLESFKPTGVNIGGIDLSLEGTEQNFIHTIDLRPRIDALAQVELSYDSTTGEAKWTLTSLDPMTMEETYDIMQGILPVNNGGDGEAQVTYSIRHKGVFEEGTKISNKASIVFDFENAIETPVWTNTIDATSPTSHVTSVEMKNDSTLTINFTGEDNLSGVWHYDVYYRWKDNMDWICIANGCDSTAFDKTAAFGYKYEFCVLATDSAGNVEQKELAPEFEFYTGLLGDVNKDGEVTVADVSGAVSIILEEPGTEAMNAMAADVNRDGNISVADASGIVSIILGLPLESKARRVMATRGSDLLDIAPIAMDYGETLSIPVSTANGNSNYVAMQFDLTLPQGVELVGVKGTNEHSCRMATLASGKKRVVCLSQRNETMTAQSLILVLKSSDKAVAGTIDIDGIELVGSKMNASHPEAISVPICVGDATSIDIVNGDGQDGSTYDLSGRKVKDAQKGVYIQDGKPVYIDK